MKLELINDSDLLFIRSVVEDFCFFILMVYLFSSVSLVVLMMSWCIVLYIISSIRLEDLIFFLFIY